MMVRLIAHTPSAERICGVAAKTRDSEWIPNTDDEGVSDALGSAMDSGDLSVLEHATFTFAVEDISMICFHRLLGRGMGKHVQHSQPFIGPEGYWCVMPQSFRECGWRAHSLDPIHLTPVTYDMTDEFKAIVKDLQNAYRRLLKEGVPEEDAQYILPMACAMDAVVTMDARELLGFIEENICPRAHWEIRDLAERMRDLVVDVCPRMFRDAGPRCMRMGYCPKKNGCGRYPPKEAHGEVSQ